MTADLSHQFGQPLQFSATGDLLIASGSDYTTQRVLRRLLTAPGATPFHPEYGAGLPSMVGDPANALKIAGITRRQMRLEKRVDQTTPPVVTVGVNPNGTVTANIAYVDDETGQTATMTTVPVMQPVAPVTVVGGDFSSEFSGEFSGGSGSSSIIKSDTADFSAVIVSVL